MFDGFEASTIDTDETTIFIRRKGNGPPRTHGAQLKMFDPPAYHKAVDGERLPRILH